MFLLSVTVCVAIFNRYFEKKKVFDQSQAAFLGVEPMRFESLILKHDWQATVTEHRDAELQRWNTFEDSYLQFVRNCCSMLPWSLQWNKWMDTLKQIVNR